MVRIEYKINAPISTDQFITVLKNSTLGERRPLNDRDCMTGMVTNSNLIVSAWHESELIGVARALTDFHYACYVSELAVNQSLQKHGVGKKLLALTQQQLGPQCRLILIAAPAANTYYQPLGFVHNPRCWVWDRETVIS